VSGFSAEGFGRSGERAKVCADLRETSDPLLKRHTVIGKPAHQVYALILHESARLDQHPANEAADFVFRI
jgi:hypothetical protein